MGQDSSQYLNRLACFYGRAAAPSLSCSDSGKIGRRIRHHPPWSIATAMHRTNDRTDYLAPFPLKSEPFMKYPARAGANQLPVAADQAPAMPSVTTGSVCGLSSVPRRAR